MPLMRCVQLLQDPFHVEMLANSATGMWKHRKKNHDRISVIMSTIIINNIVEMIITILLYNEIHHPVA
jgi:hypothetical protein